MSAGGGDRGEGEGPRPSAGEGKATPAGVSQPDCLWVLFLRSDGNREKAKRNFLSVSNSEPRVSGP
jgi:hypothetical protein